MKRVVASFAILCVALFGSVSTGRAQEFSAENMRQLNVVNEYWAAQTRMARSLVRGKIVIVMLDDQGFRFGSVWAFVRSLSAVAAASPKAIFLDVIWAGKSGDVAQETYDRLYPQIVPVKGGDVRRQGAKGILPLGAPKLFLPQTWGVFGLLNACESKEGPQAMFLVWEVASGIHSLPYHKDCARWREQYGFLKTVINPSGEQYIPFQYFGEDFFTKVSSTDLLDGRVDPLTLKDKIVFIGSITPGKDGLVDRHPTIFGTLDGTEILAHALATLMTTLKY